MEVFDMDIWKSWQIIEMNVCMTYTATQTSLHPQAWPGGAFLGASMMQEGMETVVDGGKTMLLLKVLNSQWGTETIFASQTLSPSLLAEGNGVKADGGGERWVGFVVG